MWCRSSTWNLFHSLFHFLGFFLYIRNTYFQEHLRVFVIHCFTAICQATIYSICFFKKSEALLILVSYKLVILLVIDKFTIIEFTILITTCLFWCLLQHSESTFAEFLPKKGIFQISPSGCLFYCCIIDLLICK